MRTEVAKGKDRTIRVAADQKRLAQHHSRRDLAPSQPAAWQCVVPGVSQRRGGILDHILSERMIANRAHRLARRREAHLLPCKMDHRNFGKDGVEPDGALCTRVAGLLLRSRACSTS